MPTRPVVVSLLLAAVLLTARPPVGAAAQPTPSGRSILFETPFDAPLADALSGDGWDLDDGTPFDGPNLRHRGTLPGTLRVAVDLRDNNIRAVTLAYAARRTASYAPDRVSAAFVPDDGGPPVSLWTPGSGLPSAASAWTDVEHVLPVAVLGVRGTVEVTAGGGASSASNIRFDDLRVTAALFADAAPRSVSLTAAPGGRTTATVVVANTSDGTRTFEAPPVPTPPFEVDAAGGFTLAPGASRSVGVACAPSESGAWAGRLVLPHDAGTLAVPLDCVSGAAASFGWKAAADSLLEDTVGHAWPLDLRSEAPLQAVSFRLAWEPGGGAWSFRALTRCEALGDARLAVEPDGPSAVRAVLWSEVGGGLPAAPPSGCLAAVFDVARLADVDSVRTDFVLSDVEAARASPNGVLVPLVGERRRSGVVLRRWSALLVRPLRVDFPATRAGATAVRIFELSNPGTVPVTVTDAATTAPRFSLPALAPPLTLAPGAVRDVPLAFAPTPNAFGWETAVVRFAHDGDGPPGTDAADSLVVTGIGTGGWGDGSGDGRVDVEDLLLVVDRLLGRASSGEAAPLDVHPPDAPDGRTTVGDLAVLLQAVARGEGPTGQPLPVPPPDDVGGADKRGGVLVRAVVRTSPDGLALDLAPLVGVRGVQLELAVDPPAAILAEPTGEGVVVRTAYDADRGLLRTVVLQTDGGALAPGTYPLVRLRGARRVASVDYAVAVDEQGRRGRVQVEGVSATDAERPSSTAVGRPYPNPFRRGAGAVLRLVVPAAGPDARAAVFDALGRRVARLLVRGGGVVWTGDDAAGRRVPPGVYAVVVTHGREVVRRTVVVL